MNAAKALEAMMDGIKIRRPEWGIEDYITVDFTGDIVDEKGLGYAMNTRYTDYEIVTEYKWKYATIYDGEIVVSVDYLNEEEAAIRGYTEDNKLKFTAKEF